jgi:hypothetical protein
MLLPMMAGFAAGSLLAACTTGRLRRRVAIGLLYNHRGHRPVTAASLIAPLFPPARYACSHPGPDTCFW